MKFLIRLYLISESMGTVSVNLDVRNSSTSTTSIAISGSNTVPLTATIEIAENSAAGSVSEDDRFNKNCFIYFSHNQQNYFRCDLCAKHPDIIRRFGQHGDKIPAIATSKGTRYRTNIMTEHCATTYHKECIKIKKIALLKEETPLRPMGMEVMLKKSQQAEASRVGGLLMQVYFDAKRLSLAANSWPARYVVGKASQNYDFAKSEETIPRQINLQYVNPPSHHTLLTCIVEAERHVIMDKISKCHAMSLRIDGSIDRSQIDKIYVLAKIVNSEGQLELIFLGMAEQTQRGAVGLLAATIAAIENNFGSVFAEVVLKKISSICTDGANVNIGERGGLWKLLEDHIRKAGSSIPLIKLWCAAHRSDLSWKDLTSTKSHPPEVKVVGKILNILSNLASYFHSSSTRTHELKATAEKYKLTLRAMPKLYSVRWTEYTFQLVQGVLVSWNALIIFLEAEKRTCAKAIGFLHHLKNINFLKMITFLCDLLNIYKRFQKKCQSDSLTLLKLAEDVDAMLSLFERIEAEPIAGGFEQRLKDDVTENLGEFHLKGIQLNNGNLFRFRSVNSVEMFRQSVSTCLHNCVQERFQMDSDVLVPMLKTFTKIDASADLVKLHELIAADLDLNEIAMQYVDLCNYSELKGKDLSEIVKFLASPTRSEMFKEVLIAFSRILAATPHSADVERAISANNLLKTPHRNRFGVEAENKYLFVHFNLPALEEWDPKRAVVHWNKSERRARDVLCEGKPTTQKYFKGVFKDASDSKVQDDDDDTTSESEEY